MKRKIIAAIASCVFIFILVCALFAFHDAGVMGRHDWAESSMEHLAWRIEDFRQDHGKYPSSLAELTSQSEDAQGKKIVADILQAADKAHLRLEYRSMTNRFAVTISGIDSWRPKQDKIEKIYAIGDAFK